MNEFNFTEEQLAEAESLNMALTEYVTCLDMLRETNEIAQRIIDKLDESNARMEAEMQKQGSKPKQ